MKLTPVDAINYVELEFYQTGHHHHSSVKSCSKSAVLKLRGRDPLELACATSGPRATSGPPSTLLWPASYVWSFLTITLYRAKFKPIFLALEYMYWPVDILLASNVAREVERVAHPCFRGSQNFRKDEPNFDNEKN